MRCVQCESPRLHVVDSRNAGQAIRRRRACEACGARFTTYERRESYVCPRCGADDARVQASTRTDAGTARRRRCGACSFRFETLERLAHLEVRVRKAGGGSEPFNRGKLYRSIMVAGAKRPAVSSTWAEATVNDIDRSVLDSGASEVASARVASLVMERLVTRDEVAYVRYASSYFEQDGIQEMLDVINQSRRVREQMEIERSNLPLVPSDAQAS